VTSLTALKGGRSHVTGHPLVRSHPPEADPVNPQQRVLSRKARKSSRVACGCFVRVGERIIRTADGCWQCAACVIAAITTQTPEPRRTP